MIAVPGVGEDHVPAGDRGAVRIDQSLLETHGDRQAVAGDLHRFGQLRLHGPVVIQPEELSGDQVQGDDARLMGGAQNVQIGELRAQGDGDRRDGQFGSVSAVGPAKSVGPPVRIRAGPQGKKNPATRKSRCMKPDSIGESGMRPVARGVAAAGSHRHWLSLLDTIQPGACARSIDRIGCKGDRSGRICREDEESSTGSRIRPAETGSAFRFPSRIRDFRSRR